MKKSFLFVLILMIQLLNAQEGVQEVRGYYWLLDSMHKIHLKHFLDQNSAVLPVKDFRKYNEVFPDWDFVALQLLYVYPPVTSSFVIHQSGFTNELSKELLDSIFVLNTSKSKSHLELLEHYIILSGGGLLISDVEKLVGWSKEDIEKLRQVSRDYENPRCQVSYSYLREKRSVYRYEFWFDDDGNWTQPPRRSLVLREVGLMNYYR